MNRKGFAPIVAMLVVAAILVIGGIWYYGTHEAKPSQVGSPAPAVNLALTNTTATASSVEVVQPNAIQYSILGTKFRVDILATKDTSRFRVAFASSTFIFASGTLAYTKQGFKNTYAFVVPSSSSGEEGMTWGDFSNLDLQTGFLSQSNLPGALLTAYITLNAYKENKLTEGTTTLFQPETANIENFKEVLADVEIPSGTVPFRDVIEWYASTHNNAIPFFPATVPLTDDSRMSILSSEYQQWESNKAALGSANDSNSEAAKIARDQQRQKDLDALKEAISLDLSMSLNPSICPEKNELFASADISGYSQLAATSSNSLNIDGTGWLPIDFRSKNGPPITTLPKDPVNDPAKHLVYIYACDPSKNSFEIEAQMESKEYQKGGQFDAVSMDGGNNPNAFEVGNVSGLIPSNIWK